MDVVIEEPIIVQSNDVILGSPVTVKTVVSLDPINVAIGNGITKSSLWTGEGPPHLIIGASVGDEYLDTISGTLYRLDPGE